MKNKRNILLLTAILTLASSQAAFGTSIQHTGLDSARSKTVEIKVDGSVRSVRAGVAILSVDGTALVDAFCVNLFQGITLNQTYAAESILPAGYDLDGGAAAWLMETYLPIAGTRAEGAALQLAIWDTIHDSGNGLGAGRIRASANTDSTILSLAQTWLDASAGKSSNNAKVFTASAGQRVFQQQLYLTAQTPNGEVPEPGTMAMMAGGAIALGAFRRRQRAAK
jgi:hypothetical protein